MRLVYLLAMGLLMLTTAAHAQDSVKQMQLTEAQLQNLLAASPEVNAIIDKANDPERKKPSTQAALEAAAKKYGFKSMDEMDDVYDNVGLILSGIDPATKQFDDPPEVLKKQLAEIQADTKIPAAEKKQMLDEINAALKVAKPVQFRSNIDLVKKHYEQLRTALAPPENSGAGDKR